MNIKFSTATLAVVIVASLASCSVYKNYERPSDLKTENLYGNALTEGGGESMASLGWRDIYTDPCLQALIERALANNNGLKAQQWAVEQAKASHTQSKLAYLPSLSRSPGGAYNTPSQSLDGKNWTYQIPVALDWELDIFGGLHNQRKMAKAALGSQQDLLQAVESRLIATVASCYYQLLALDQTQLVVRDAYDVWEDLIKAADALLEAGEIGAVAVTQFKGQKYDIEATSRTLERNILNADLDLCSLLGEEPHNIERGSLTALHAPQSMATGVSSALLANRPDVRQAERDLEYFYHNERYATSNFFPKFNINAQTLFNGAWMTSILGSLTQPVFARGKVIAGKKIAKAQYEQAKVNYQQKLIDASAEVVKAMKQFSTAHDNSQTRQLQVDEYNKTVSYSKTLMFNGECTYLDVLSAETNLFATRQALIDSQLDEMLAVVNLYLALGGGSR